MQTPLVTSIVATCERLRTLVHSGSQLKRFTRIEKKEVRYFCVGAVQQGVWKRMEALSEALGLQATDCTQGSPQFPLDFLSI
jgi:hypothetical protein